MEPKDYLEQLQEQINQIIGTESTLKRRKKTREDNQREIFISVIPLLEHVVNRETMLEMDYGISMSRYNELFFQVIDGFIYMTFHKEAADVIMFYLYDRLNPDGSINELLDINGDEVVLENVDDLWDLVKQIEAERK
jgi:hypothetical protein